MFKEARCWLASDEKLKQAAAEEVGDDVILQQIDAEEVAEIEHEGTTVPDS